MKRILFIIVVLVALSVPVTASAQEASTPEKDSATVPTQIGSGTQAAWLFAVFGLGALVFGISGAAVARKSR